MDIETFDSTIDKIDDPPIGPPTDFAAEVSPDGPEHINIAVSPEEWDALRRMMIDAGVNPDVLQRDHREIEEYTVKKTAQNLNI